MYNVNIKHTPTFTQNKGNMIIPLNQQKIRTDAPVEDGRISSIQTAIGCSSQFIPLTQSIQPKLCSDMVVGMAMVMGLCTKMANPTSIGQCSFFKGSTPICTPSSATCGSAAIRTARPCCVPVRALKMMTGKVICATNDKTVAVEVVRLAPHPKYKKRVRSKKKYQAHDPDNKFKVGDLVQLKKSAPISKTKAFLALPVPPRRSSPKPAQQPQELSLPIESANA